MKSIFLSCLIVTLSSYSFVNQSTQPYTIDEDQFLFHTVDLAIQDLKFHWKDEKGIQYKDFNRLKSDMTKNGEQLLFAMNGGMYKKDLSPQGLYIENGELKSPMDTISKGYGNFYLQPNGVFYLTTDHRAHVKKSSNFEYTKNIQYATQSGPMLLIDGDIHPKFNRGSSNLNIRNGVGILPNGHILFAMSKAKINFYDFATFFKQRGCKNALYLDGFVSRTYLPTKNSFQTGSNFGVIIGETSEKKPAR